MRLSIFALGALALSVTPTVTTAETNPDAVNQALSLVEQQNFLECSRVDGPSRTSSTRQHSMSVLERTFVACFGPYISAKLEEFPKQKSMDAMAAARQELKTVKKEVLDAIFLTGCQSDSDWSCDADIKAAQSCLDGIHADTGRWDIIDAFPLKWEPGEYSPASTVACETIVAKMQRAELG